MLEQPRQSYGFARYTYRGENEVTMGYEYENKHYQRRGYTERDIAAKEKSVTDVLSVLPNYFQAQYEGFGQSAGIEIKSVVAPLFLHKQFWNRSVSKLPFDETPHSREHDAGIHVSISTTPYTTRVQPKVFTFLHNPDHRPTFFRLSKRTKYSFDLNAPSNPQGNPFLRWNECTQRSDIVMRDIPAWPDHYNIINTENTERYEFRLFAAHPTLLLPALEMCDSLFKMAPDVDTITMSGWRDYISSFKKYEHIKEHSIATLDHSPS